MRRVRPVEKSITGSSTPDSYYEQLRARNPGANSPLHGKKDRGDERGPTTGTGTSSTGYHPQDRRNEEGSDRGTEPRPRHAER